MEQAVSGLGERSSGWVEFSHAMCQGLRAWDRVVFSKALSPPLGGGVGGFCCHCVPPSPLEVKLGTVAMLPYMPLRVLIRGRGLHIPASVPSPVTWGR